VGLSEHRIRELAPHELRLIVEIECQLLCNVFQSSRESNRLFISILLQTLLLKCVHLGDQLSQNLVELLRIDFLGVSAC